MQSTTPTTDAVSETLWYLSKKWGEYTRARDRYQDAQRAVRNALRGEPECLFADVPTRREASTRALIYLLECERRLKKAYKEYVPAMAKVQNSNRPWLVEMALSVPPTTPRNPQVDCTDRLDRLVQDWTEYLSVRGEYCDAYYEVHRKLMIGEDVPDIEQSQLNIATSRLEAQATVLCHDHKQFKKAMSRQLATMAKTEKTLWLIREGSSES